MREVGNTYNILYRYLRALSVEVSYATVNRLLATPVGNTMRGMSDTLDRLKIENSVYQLPSGDYFNQLEAPFIAMLNSSTHPFCTVVSKEANNVEYYDEEGRRHCLPEKHFITRWTGIVLIGETTKQTIREPFYRIKNILYQCFQGKSLIVIGLITGLGLGVLIKRCLSPLMFLHFAVLTVGLLTSWGIVYKEFFNDKFMEQFCYIGQVVNCNEVIHSKGSTLFGYSLGELSLLYFGVLLFYCLINDENSLIITICCTWLAFAFTIYSVIYQAFVLHKACLLCIWTDVCIWLDTALLSSFQNDLLDISWNSIFLFICIGIFCIIGLSFLKDYRRDKEIVQRYSLQQSYLYRTDVLHKLQELEAVLNEDVPLEITLSNNLIGKEHLVLVTNPNCKNCARIHAAILSMDNTIPIHLLFITHPDDAVGQQVVRHIITVYQNEGWKAAMSALQVWFETQQLPKIIANQSSESVRKQQEAYCRKQGINKTPSIFLNRQQLPDIYPLEQLEYLLI